MSSRHLAPAVVTLLVVAASTPGQPVPPRRTGVVFIHGKGERELATPAKAREYWSEDMIRAVTRGYGVPHLVCAYDGTSHIWAAAAKVAGQMQGWIARERINDIIVETHSFGGVVIRWILSNPSYDSRYQPIIERIRWVNSIAPPNRGSEAADLAGTLSGPWLTGWLVDLVGQDNDSTRDCRTERMAYYNQYWLKGTSGRPPLPRPVYNVAGTGLWNDSIHPVDWGLATLSAVAGLPGDDDGAVARYSAQSVGTVKFTTDANHHHNRRNDFRRIGDRLAAEF